MSEQKPAGSAQAPPEEPFLERWSRRKADVKAGIAVEADAPLGDSAPEPQPDGQAEAPAEVVLPDLDSLDADSDYSAFMSPGVDDLLRRKALRKLFSSPKFNVCDGLDDYCGDFTQFASLGDIVTADMKHHLERAARAAAQALEDTSQEDGPVALAAAPTAPSDASATATPAEQQKDEHDETDRPA